MFGGGTCVRLGAFSARMMGGKCSNKKSIARPWYGKPPRAQPYLMGHLWRLTTGRTIQPGFMRPIKMSRSRLSPAENTRIPNEARDALMDLVLHPLPKKLLLLVPARMKSPGDAVILWEAVLARLCRTGSYRVVLLAGSYSSDHFTENVRRVSDALKALSKD